MADQFIAMFAERLRVTEAVAQSAFESIVRRMGERLERDGSVELPALGTLRKVDGEIVFEAAERAARMVNHRYAGMPVLEAEPVVRDETAFAPSVAEIAEDDPFARVHSRPERLQPEEVPLRKPLRELSSEEPPADEVAEQPEVAPPEPEEESPEPSFFELETDESVFPEEETPLGEEDLDEDDEEADRAELERLLEGVWTPPMEAPAKGHPLGEHDLLEDADFQVVSPESSAFTPDDSELHDESAFMPPPPSGPADSDPPAEPVSTDMPPTPVSPRSEQRPPEPADHDDRPRRKSGGFGLLLVIAALVLIATAGIVYWLLIEHPDSPATPEPTAEVQPTPPPVEEPDLVADPDEPDLADPATPAEDTPLRSAEGVDPGAGGFTWVISEPSAASAENRAERYREQGYRVSVLPATVGGTTYHRVAIGQFTTRAEAERHRAELPRDVPQDIWILAL